MTHWIIMPFIDCLDMTEVALLDCIQQDFTEEGEVAILLIDQGSAPESQERISEWHSDLRVWGWRHNPPLPSLAATWNRALEFVWTSGADHALVVNNDVRLPRGTYDALLQVQRETDAWFVTAVNVGPAWYPGMTGHAVAVTESLKASRGGPDFSCYLMTKECHRRFQFDEGFIPAYHEDNDYHRRLQLAGFGEKIFSVPIPYLHYGSATINRSEASKAAWPARFKLSQDYYVRKWGGLPGHETYTVPFNADEIQRVVDAPFKIRE